MLNKILINQIINNLLRDVFYTTDITYAYEIKDKKTFYEITITAFLRSDHTILTKYKTIRIKNWVELIIGYDNLKQRIKSFLIDNIKEEICY